MQPENARFAIIIPFFQKTTGVLRRTLSSVMVATNNLEFTVIVVDDGTEIGVAADLEGLPEQFCSRIKVLRQPNAGPGAARNAGLEIVPEDADFIAFLDSDDSWVPDHLRRAAAALSLGYDFYFADFLPLNRLGTAFEQTKFGGDAGRPTIQPQVYAVPNGLASLLHGLHPISTTTIVFNRRKLGGIRFPTDLRWSREDHAYLLGLAKEGPGTCFSTTVDCICGEGVNVYAGADSESRHKLLTLIDELRFAHSQLSDASLNATQVDWYRRRLGVFREEAAACMLSWLRLRCLTREHLMMIWRVDKLVYLRIPYRVLIFLWRIPLRFRDLSE